MEQKTDEKMEEMKQKNQEQQPQAAETQAAQGQQPAQEGQAQTKPQRANLIADGDVDWKELEQFGVKKENLSEKDMKALMNYGKTGLVTVTPTSDGALTATVECLQAFGEQIYVVVASRDYADVTAKCTVDYKKRVVDADVKITKVGTGEVSAVDLTRTSTKYLFEAVPVLGVGTIETDIYYFAYMLPSSDLATFAKSHSVSIVRDDTEYNVSWCSDDDISSHFTVSTSSIFNLACSPRVANTTFISRIFQNALVDYSGETLMTIKFNFFETSEQAHKYEDSGDAFSLGFVAVDIPVGMIDLVVSVTGVGLDNSSIIF